MQFTIKHGYVELQNRHETPVNLKNKHFLSGVLHFHDAGVAAVLVVEVHHGHAHADAAAELEHVVVALRGVVVLLQHLHHHLVLLRSDVVVLQAEMEHI